MKLIGKKTSVIQKENELSIVIAASENKSNSYLVLFWLICFSICGGIIISQYFKTTDEKFKVFLIVFTGFWFYFELRALYAFLWKRFGKEIINLKDGQLFFKKDILNKGKIIAYDPLYIKKLRLKKGENQNASGIFTSIDWLTGTDSLTFDYNGKQVHFGFMLNDPDAQELLKLLKQKMRL